MDPVIAHLKPGRDKQASNQHPWIFSGAIGRWQGAPQVGSVTDVFSHEGRFLGRGLAHPKSDLAVRVYAWREGQDFHPAFWAARLRSAIQLRRGLFDPARTNACRLVFSESDGLSGLIVDQYADVLAVRIGAAALLPYLNDILAALVAESGCPNLVVSVDKDIAAREMIDPASVASRSTAVRTSVEILEQGLRFEVDLSGGQKTGYYLDQRDNRARVAAYAKGRRVLGAYCYTGAFEIYAARAGASEVTGLDSSAPALAGARRHAELNGVTAPLVFREADVPETLRRCRDSRQTFDLIILDPPRFVMNAAQKEKGLRAYKDINLLGLKLLTPGGILATFSCSGLVTLEDLKLTLRWAAKDSGRTVRFIDTLSQPPDHPVLTSFPEAEYLTGLLLHVD